VLAVETLLTGPALSPASTNASAAANGSATAAAAIAAASLIEEILTASPNVSVTVARAATTVVSSILSLEERAGGVRPEVATSVHAALTQLVRAARPDASGGALTLTSANINVSVAQRSAAQLDLPVVCPTDVAPVSASLPSGLLSVVDVDAAAPVSVLLYSSAINLHAAAPSPPASPFVSLSLLQFGEELRVANSPTPIEIRIPLIENFDAGGDGGGSDGGGSDADGASCIGHAAAISAGCSSHLECRWWNSSAHGWSSAGCTTLAAPDESVTCSCDHLTDFVVFEVPTSFDEFLDDIAKGFSIHGLSSASLECFANPGRIPHIYATAASLLVLAAILLAHATARDSDEIAMVESLVAGRKREQKLKLRRRLLEAARWSGRSALLPQLLRRSSIAPSSSCSLSASASRSRASVAEARMSGAPAHQPPLGRSSTHQTDTSRRLSSTASRSATARRHVTDASQLSSQQHRGGDLGVETSAVAEGRPVVQGAVLKVTHEPPHPTASLVEPEATPPSPPQHPLLLNTRSSASGGSALSSIDLLAAELAESSQPNPAGVPALAPPAPPQPRRTSWAERSSGNEDNDAPIPRRPDELETVEAISKETAAASAQTPRKLQLSAAEACGGAETVRVEEVGADGASCGVECEIGVRTHLGAPSPRSSLTEAAGGVFDSVSSAEASGEEAAEPSCEHAPLFTRPSNVRGPRWSPSAASRRKPMVLQDLVSAPPTVTLTDGEIDGELGGASGEAASEEAVLRIQRAVRLRMYARRFHNATALASMPSPLRQLQHSGSNVAKAVVSAFRGAVARLSPRIGGTGRWQRVGSTGGGSTEHWRRARMLKSQVVLTRRWHSDVDRGWKRMVLACKGSHTLVAGVFCRGAMGFTRAQTCMVLLNSLALELLVLCMLYSAPGDGPLVINPVQIVSSGMLAACICVPGMVFFAWLFTPRIILNVLLAVGRMPLRAAVAIARFSCASACLLGGQARRGGAGEARARGPLPQKLRRCSWTSTKVAPAAGVATGAAEEEAPGAVATRGFASAEHGDSLGDGAWRRSSSVSDARFSYASLNEHMLRLSLRRTLRMRDRAATARILFGWGCNWLLFFGMLTLFTLYGCEFRSLFGASGHAEALMLSWAWSVGQRFIVNEPALIGLAKGLPMLFSSAFCANVCNETCANSVALMTDLIISFCKALRAGG